MYWKTISIHILLISSILLQSTVHASIVGRKHSTAHYFSNGTIYILGGIDKLGLNATKTQFASSMSLLLNKKDFSLSSSVEKSVPVLIPPTIGHTSHLHVPSNSIISVFGMQQQNKESPPLIPSASSIKQNALLPSGRYEHTSVLINSDIFVIGGKHVPKTENQKFIESQDMIWNYSFTTQTWKRLSATVAPSRSGHITFVYKQWLVSCFGQSEESKSNNSCTWFDTITFNSTEMIPNSSIREWPTARSYASMISLENNTHVLFGGEQSQDIILDDMWKLDVDSAFKMTWQKVNYSKNGLDSNYYKRSGHASTLLGNENVVLYYGGQNGPLSLATDPIYFDLSKMEWIHTNNTNGDNHYTIHQNDVDLTQSNESHTLGSGAIIGIIMSTVVIVVICIGLFIWRRRHNRQQNIYYKSRAARFSQSPTPMYSMQHKDEEKQNSKELVKGENRIGRTTGLADRNFLSLPELALSRESSNNRISAISLGAEFRFSADEYSSHQSVKTIPKIELLDKKESTKLEVLSEEEGLHNNYGKKRESTGFKRLTLNLFSGSQQENENIRKRDRSSSLFQLRASKLLQPITPATPDGKFPHTPISALQSRVSLGAKSVASVQWVGFNDTMDYKGNNWRDSSNSSMHLAVTNAQRASSYYSDSNQSTPRSPMFPSHLRDSAVHYQLNESEPTSWKSEKK